MEDAPKLFFLRSVREQQNSFSIAAARNEQSVEKGFSVHMKSGVQSLSLPSPTWKVSNRVFDKIEHQHSGNSQGSFHNFLLPSRYLSLNLFLKMSCKVFDCLVLYPFGQQRFNYKKYILADCHSSVDLSEPTNLQPRLKYEVQNL